MSLNRRVGDPIPPVPWRDVVTDIPRSRRHRCLKCTHTRPAFMYPVYYMDMYQCRWGHTITGLELHNMNIDMRIRHGRTGVITMKVWRAHITD